jgi:amino acid adenylation domain-containing protein
MNTIQQLLHDSFGCHAGLAAVSYGADVLSYSRLDEITSYGSSEYGYLPSGKRIAVFVTNRLRMLTSCISIFRAQSVFVPVEPGLPDDRISFILIATGCSHVITDGENEERLSGIMESIPLKPVLLNPSRQPVPVQAADEHHTPAYSIEDDLYIYFTSGSTGNPKGVSGTNRGLAEFIEWEIAAFNLQPGMRYSQFVNAGFDAWLRDVFVPLCSGGTCVLPQGDEVPGNATTMMSWLNENRVNAIHCVPSLFRLINNTDIAAGDYPELKYVFLSGERIVPGSLTNWYKVMGERIQLVNFYGPTETTMIKFFHLILPADAAKESIPAGRGITGTTLYLLDRQLRPVANNMTGEIYIHTTGITRGYLNEPELTAQVFLPSPFQKGQVIYKTGDQGLLQDDGNLILRGRTDRQLKIQGARVEPEEIEACICSMPGIQQAVVNVSRQSQSAPSLLAYAVAAPEVSEKAIREYLIGKLPVYMLPASIMLVESIPVKLNGKVDYAALPDVPAVYQAPVTETEKKLAAIWTLILGNDTVAGLESNFFISGGHSLNAAVLSVRIEQQWNITFPVRNIFTLPGLREMASAIDKAPSGENATILPAAVQARYPLGPAQERLYFLQMYDTASTAYNLTTILKIQGKTDAGRLREVLTVLTERHSALRTGYTVVDGIAYQYIDDKVTPQFEEIQGDENSINAIIKKFVRPFKMESAPLFRVGLIHISNNEACMVFDVHHSVCDGTSLGIIVKESMLLYQHQSPGDKPVQFIDYTEWHNKGGNLQRLEKQRLYWNRVLSGTLPVMQLPYDFARPAKLVLSGNSYRFALPADLPDKLKALANEHNTTLYNVLLCGYAVMLHHITGQDEVIIGTTAAGRMHAAVLDTVGMFANALALRLVVNPSDSFEQLLSHVVSHTTAALDNQEYPFENIVREIIKSRDASRNPVFDVMFNLQNLDIPEMKMEGITLTQLEFEKNIAKFDLTLRGMEKKDCFEFTFEYNSKLFRQASIERFAGFLIRIYAAFTGQPGIAAGDIEIISTKERRDELLYTQGEAAVFPSDMTITKLFDEVVRRNPDSVAIRCGSNEFSYEAVNKGVQAIAVKLTAVGVRPGSAVAIEMNHSPELVMAAMAVLRCGATYVPVDPAYPAERKQYMAAACNIQALIADKGTDTRNYSDAEIIYPDDILINDAACYHKAAAGSPHDTAYVIFTSGSTGKPKGVQVSHSALINYVFSAAAHYIRQTQSSFAFFTSFSFDLTVTSVFVPLLTGNSISICKPAKNEALTLTAMLADDSIRIIKLTPSHLRLMDQLGEVPPNIDTIVVGGERLPYDLAFSIYRKSGGRVAIYNEYGPTEATVGCMYHKFDAGEIHDTVPIGKPLFNNSIYLLNSNQKLVPHGTAGEIFIGGAQLAHGYAGEQELTQSRFIDNPFDPGSLIYRTGDLARRLTDGSLIYMGRKDEQIKYRGYRIEPGEIESQLMRIEGVTAAAVTTVVMQGGEVTLVAWYTAVKPLQAASLKKALSVSIPVFMLPVHYIPVENLPLTVNGKLDKAALPLPAAENAENAFLQDGDEPTVYNANTAAVLSKIWSNLLAIPRAGIQPASDFFISGGHSLTAISLVAAIEKELNITLPVASVFEHSQFQQQVKLAETMMSSANSPAQPSTPGPLPAEKRSSYPLTSVQRRLYFLYQLTPDTVTYNIPFFYEVEGKFDVKEIENAFRQIISRHENFRTVFRPEYGQPRQFVLDETVFSAEQYHVRNIEEAAALFVRPFILEEAPPVRAGFAFTETGKNYLMLDLHHIISDEITFEKLMHELLTLIAGRELAQPGLQYKDYAVWQQESPAYQERVAAQKEFWLDMLSGELPGINLPADFARPPVKTYNGDIVSRRLDAASLDRLKAIATQLDVTLYMLMFSVYHILISKLCNTNDVITGTITAGRRQQELESVMGAFVNTILLRTHPTAGMFFADFLKTVKKLSVDSFDNQEYPYEDLLENLNIERDISRNPLFEIMFNMHPVENRTVKLDGISIKPWYPANGFTTKFDLNLQIHYAGDELELQFYYASSIYKRSSAEQWADCYLNLLFVLLDNPGLKIGDMEMLNTAMRHKVIESFNNTSLPYNREMLMHRLFEQQAAAIPGNTAVQDAEGQQLTYAALNQSANELAYRLIGIGAGTGKFVSITMDRSVHTIVAVMAVLKTGAAYVPLEPYLPGQRIAGIISSLDTCAVITDTGNINMVSELCRDFELSLPVFCTGSNLQQGIYGDNVTFIGSGVAAAPGKMLSNPAVTVTADELAYVIFTSGSTGTPKGVAVKHRPVINLIEWVNRTYNISTDTKVLFTTSLAFDLSVYDIFGILAAGGIIRIASRAELSEPSRLIEILKKEQITFWDSAPAALQQLVPYFNQLGTAEACLNLVFMSGDWIPLDMHKNITAVLPDVRVVGLGGATEATVWSNYFNITGTDPTWRSIPYGKPIQNARYYILDEYCKPCPVGVKGDLYIGGECLASGYINDSVLSARKFVPDPFVNGGTMYHTGDKARWFEDGNIEFLGREDAQVKIRGYRVELGEIEHHLLGFPGLKTGKVIARKNATGQLYLCAYYQADTVMEEQNLSAYMSQFLPDYMVPSFFVHIRHFPVTVNGKLDFKSLPDPVMENTQLQVSLPENDIQEAVKKIWSSVLGVPAERISTNGDFFRTGGNSLNASAMLSEVLKVFNVAMPLVNFFQKPTIKGVAAYIEKAETASWGIISPAAQKEVYPLSPAQQRMFTIQYLNPGLTAYNMLVAFRLSGSPSIDLMQAAFEQVIAQHETLRTSFELGESGIVQRIHPKVNLSIEKWQAGEAPLDDTVKAFRRPFELSEAPLFRAGIITQTSDNHVLVLDMHHIISDGMTMNILVNDLNKCFAGETLTPPALHYKDYVEWQLQQPPENMQQQRDYWLKQFEGQLPVMHLPGFENRNGLPAYDGDTIRFRLDADVQTAVTRIAAEENATTFMVIMAAINMFFGRISGLEDIIIGSPVAGRRHPGLRDVAGLFVNVLAVRNQPAGYKTFRQFVKEVRHQMLDAYNNQEYQFDDLVNELVKDRDWSRNPLFDVYFFMDNIGIGTLEIPGTDVTLYEEKKPTTQYDIMIGISAQNDELGGTFSYRTSLFTREQAEGWCSIFSLLTGLLVANPDIPADSAAAALTPGSTAGTAVQL